VGAYIYRSPEEEKERQFLHTTLSAPQRAVTKLRRYFDRVTTTLPPNETGRKSLDGLVVCGENLCRERHSWQPGMSTCTEVAR
jgi:hypothetical protein